MTQWLRQLLFGWMFGSPTSASFTNGEDLKPEAENSQLRRLETKVGFLTALSVAQTAMLAVLLMWSFVPDMSTMIIWGLLVVAFVAVFHKFIPGWLAFAFRAIKGTADAGAVSKSESKPGELG